MYKILRRCRVVLSLLFLIAFTLIFIDIYGSISIKLIGLLKWQIVPSILGIASGSLAMLSTLLLITFFFGRVYCSTLCPLGTFQDGITRVANVFKTKKQKRFNYDKPKNYWRYGIFTIALALFVAGSTAFLLWLDPYSNYGRVAENLFRPIVIFGNNLLTHVSDSIPSHQFKELVWSSSLAAAVLLLLVAGFSAFRGRLWCNMICPVGSFLGLISRYSAFRISIDKETCTGCSLCERKCKAQCIDAKAKVVDHSRCVQCLNCMQVCSANAIKHRYSFAKKSVNAEPNDPSLRRTLIGSIGTLGAAAVYHAVGSPLRITSQNTKAIAPPGARSVEQLKKHCTACHACVANCPTQVLRPAVGEYGIDGFMLPVMDYNLSFCNYECTVCSGVCPNGALTPLTVEEKVITQIGKAVFYKDRCVVVRDGTDCGACDEHCPTKAVRMVPYEGDLLIPFVDQSICVGCGGCEYICPARPRAIIVAANPEHLIAEKPEVQEQEEIVVDDFGF